MIINQLLSFSTPQLLKSMKNQYIELSKEIADAIATKLPLIALESTIISHGMPYPQNVETALLVEKTVRENGAIPATIAILGGKLKVGLNPDEIDYLGKKGQAVLKCSRRDLPFAVTNGLDGATTVASTMIIAAMAGIKIFATGGIGGVHRGASETFDISADLQELARTNVAVVCAGAKSILDLSLTLEYLETHGVPVVGWQTNEFPAFYTRSSGLLVDYRVDSVQDLAKTLQTKWELGLQGGVVIANPIPAEFSFSKERIDVVIKQALAEANQKNIKGKEVTPFLLAKIEQLTSGSSLQSNIQLVLSNAKLAAQLSKAM